MPEPLLASPPFNSTRLFMICLCAGTALQLAWRFRDQLRFRRTQPGLVYGPPPRLLGVWTLPQLSERLFIISGLGLIAALLLAAAGVLTRPLLAAALVGHLLYFSQVADLSYIQRKPNLIAVCLLILAASPAVSAPLSADVSTWPLVFVYAAVAQMYWSSGWQKLRNGGGAWVGGITLRAHLAHHHLWAGTPAAWWLAARPTLCRLTSTAVIVWELSFPLVLVVPTFVPLYAALGVAFHIGNWVFFRIDYLTYLSPVYTVFLIPWLGSRLSASGWLGGTMLP